MMKEQNNNTEDNLPCPHGRESWRTCYHCLEINNNVEGWEKEFDEKFTSSSDFCSCVEGDMYDAFPDAIKELKDFIRSLLSAHTADIVGKMEKAKKEFDPETTDIILIDPLGVDGYNYGIDTAIDIIKTNQK